MDNLVEDNNIPICVDLDGTLIYTDMLHESAIQLLRKNPVKFLAVVSTLFEGRAYLKNQLANNTQIGVESLPYNIDLINWLRKEKEQGRRLVLCTASDSQFACQIANYLNLFDEVIASDGEINISGKRKAEVLSKRYGYAGFDYVGNSYDDLEVWKSARQAIIANAPDSLIHKAQTLCKVKEIFISSHNKLKNWFKVFRFHQWLKNILLFVPILAAHKFFNFNDWITLLLAFLAFGFLASGTYIVNDLFDLENDRHHPNKRDRPFASGVIPIWKGIIISPVLMILGFGIALLINSDFLLVMICYFFMTISYSFGIKRLMLVDCILLAILYTLRIIAGAAAISMTISFWLFAFSIFLFLSLAFVKRYAELVLKAALGSDDKVQGRGYLTTDIPLIQVFGVVSGYASILVLALYLNSDAVLLLYRKPHFVWGAVLIVLFWISWVWAQAHRGKMHDDPLIFAIKDKVSLLSGFLFGLVLLLGTTGGYPW